MENLSALLAKTSKKLRVLDQGQLEAMTGSVKSLKQQIEQSLEIAQFDSAANAKMDSKINELYDHCHKILTNRAIPHLLARYETLKSVHKQEKGLVKRLASLEKLQSDVSRKLDVCRISLDALTDSIENNVATMGRNLELVAG